jgi:uncharacterized protein (TIGR00269 family)
MQCSKCGRTAIVFQAYSGQHLCLQHFTADVEAKAKHEIRSHHWLKSGDHIAVGLSGDACSSALLYFLKKLTSNRRDIRISAISVDEGIDGYRSLKDSGRIAKLLQTECTSLSFLEIFGVSLDEISRTKGKTGSCRYCRVMRHFLLNRIARDNGITKIAFGSTLDDASGSVLKDFLLGFSEHTVGSEVSQGGKIPLIRPFIAVPKEEIALYAEVHVKEYNRSHCPYTNNHFDEDVDAMLNEFTLHHPATKYALLGLKKNLARSCVSLPDFSSSCERCGEPAIGICHNCRIIDEVTSHGA